MADGPLKAQLRRLLPRAARPHRILGGPLRGLRIVTSWHDYPAAILGRTERPLLEWFERHVEPGQTWLDVGAHYGYTALALSRLVGAQGRVFAFEPMLATAGHLARTRDLNGFAQLSIIPFALGSPATLQIEKSPAVRGMVDGTAATLSGLEVFLIARFDWLWDRICEGERRIDGVKVDVQGMEIHVLTGMLSLLREYTPKVVVEVHHGVDRAELVMLLESAGYLREAIPIEQREDDDEGEYIDDRSYYFPVREPALNQM